MYTRSIGRYVFRTLISLPSINRNFHRVRPITPCRNTVRKGINPSDCRCVHGTGAQVNKLIIKNRERNFLENVPLLWCFDKAGFIARPPSSLPPWDIPAENIRTNLPIFFIPYLQKILQSNIRVRTIEAALPPTK